MEALPEKIIIRDKYGPAMEMTDQADADAYFERCVEHCMTYGKVDRQEAERIEKGNLGYYAGYYNTETMERVQRLFRCSHPVFGTIKDNGAPTPEKALAAGMAAAKTDH